MATAAERQTEVAKATEATPEVGDNQPAYGLPMLEALAPDRGVFEPKIADELEMHKDAIKLLKELEGFSLKGDTSVYAQIMAHMAELWWRSTEGMGAKSGVEKQDGAEVKIRGITLSHLTTVGPVPKDDAWLEVKALFLEEVEKASTETGVDFKNTLDSPTLVSTLPKCYRAGVLMCFGIAQNRIFKKSPRPELGVAAEPEGTVFNSKKHVLAPAAPYNMLQPKVVYEATGKKKSEPITKPNSETFYTYMSADKAMLLHDHIFSKNTVSSHIEVNEKTGQLARKKKAVGADTSKATTESVVVKLGEGSTPEDVWRGVQAMTADLKTGEVTIPPEIQKNCVAIVQEMIENLDKADIEPLEDSLINLQLAIEEKCEASGIALNIFQQAQVRLSEIPNIFRLSDDEREPIMAMYKVIHEQVQKSAA